MVEVDLFLMGIENALVVYRWLDLIDILIMGRESLRYHSKCIPLELVPFDIQTLAGFGAHQYVTLDCPNCRHLSRI